MKTFTNIVFLCLLLYVSSLSMKHNSALNSFLQTKLHYGNLNKRAKISVFMVKCCKQTAQQRQERQGFAFIISTED